MVLAIWAVCAHCRKLGSLFAVSRFPTCKMTLFLSHCCSCDQHVVKLQQLPLKRKRYICREQGFNQTSRSKCNTATAGHTTRFTRTFHIGWPTDNVAYFLAAFSEVCTAHLRQNLLSKIFELILALPVQGVATGASPNAMPFCRGITFDLCCSLVLSSAMECASYIAALLH